MMKSVESTARRLASSPSESAANFLEAFAMTVLFFGAFTAFMVLWIKIQRRQHQRASRIRHGRPLPSMQNILQDSLGVRLVVSGLMALLILIAQRWIAEPAVDQDDNYDDDEQSNLWIAFLYVDGTLVALLILAVIHTLYWSYCKTHSGDDATAAMSDVDCDDEVFEMNSDQGDEINCQALEADLEEATHDQSASAHVPTVTSDGLREEACTSEPDLRP
jgi:hypothetical protein